MASPSRGRGRGARGRVGAASSRPPPAPAALGGRTLAPARSRPHRLAQAAPRPAVGSHEALARSRPAARRAAPSGGRSHGRHRQRVPPPGRGGGRAVRPRRLRADRRGVPERGRRGGAGHPLARHGVRPRGSLDLDDARRPAPGLRPGAVPGGGERPHPPCRLRPARRTGALAAPHEPRHRPGALSVPRRSRRRGLAHRRELRPRLKFHGLARQRRLEGPRAPDAVPLLRRRRAGRADADQGRLAPRHGPPARPRGRGGPDAARARRGRLRGIGPSPRGVGDRRRGHRLSLPSLPRPRRPAPPGHAAPLHGAAAPAARRALPPRPRGRGPLTRGAGDQVGALRAP